METLQQLQGQDGGGGTSTGERMNRRGRKRTEESGRKRRTVIHEGGSDFFMKTVAHSTRQKGNFGDFWYFGEG